MISTIEFEHGNETCADERGKFCRWLGSRRMGTLAVCILFNEEKLKDVNGWLVRCPQCKEQFK